MTGRVERVFGDTVHVRVYHSGLDQYAWVPEGSMRQYASQGWTLTDVPEEDNRGRQPAEVNDGMPVERETPASRAAAAAKVPKATTRAAASGKTEKE